jgi:hypothetical protein
MIDGRMELSMSDGSATARFSSGEMIRIGMDFLGEGSVEGAYALFVNAEKRTQTIALSGNRSEGTGTTISMEGKTARSGPPGEYRCQYVQVHDVFDNYAVLYPEPQIRFWVGQR